MAYVPMPDGSSSAEPAMRPGPNSRKNRTTGLVVEVPLFECSSCRAWSHHCDRALHGWVHGARELVGARSMLDNGYAEEVNYVTHLDLSRTEAELMPCGTGEPNRTSPMPARRM